MGGSIKKYIIDVYCDEAKEFINKMVHIYNSLENNVVFHSGLSRNQKFLALLVMTHLLFDSEEKKALEMDGYTLDVFATLFHFENEDLRHIKDSYDSKIYLYASLDMVGKDMMFDYYLIQCVNELRNHRDVLSNKNVTIKELMIGYVEAHSLEYNSFSNRINQKYDENYYYPFFWNSNLCDFYDLELNEPTGMLIPKQNAFQKIKKIE